jgi:hypothetical protein
MLTDSSASTTPSLSPSVPSSLSSSVPPSLSDSDNHRLRAFFELGLDYFALARQENIDPLELLEWLDRPEIAQRIAKMHALRKLSVEAAHDEARLVAIKTLKEIALNAKDPTDRRRAASTLMRRYDLPPRLPRRATDESLHPPEVQPQPAAAQADPFADPAPHAATPPPPVPPARPPSADTAAKVAEALLKSDSVFWATQVLHRYMALIDSTIFGTPAPRHISRFIETFAQGPLADFIQSAPRDLSPTLLKSDDTGDTYALGSLSFHLWHNGIGWGITRIDTT